MKKFLIRLINLCCSAANGHVKLFCWLLIICCSAANGYLIECFGMPWNYISLIIPSACIAGLLWWHQKFTKDWEMPLSAWDDYDSYRFPFFWVSMIVGSIALAFIIILSCFKPIPYGEGILVALTTLVIASFIGHRRERCYSVFWSL